MADCSQHPQQIMENQTCYDLNAALENWRQELAAQSGLTPEVRRELETHLCDAMAGFQQRGLSDEESFWLARRRVGQPTQLAEEFVKADPAKVWRERVFWMGVAFLVVNLWGTILQGFLQGYTIGNTRYFPPIRLENSLSDWVLFYLPHWLREFPGISGSVFFGQFIRLIPIVCCALFLSSGRLKGGRFIWQFIFQSRTRFVLLGMFLIVTVNWLSVFLSNPPEYMHASVAAMFFNRLVYSTPWDFSLVALIAWLLPPQSKKTSEPA